MFTAVNDLITSLLGDIFPAWLSVPAVEYLVSFVIVAYVIRILLALVRQ